MFHILKIKTLLYCRDVVPKNRFSVFEYLGLLDFLVPVKTGLQPLTDYRDGTFHLSASLSLTCMSLSAETLCESVSV